jgi:hypothetical protein
MQYLSQKSQIFGEHTCGLVLASRPTNLYKISIFGDTVMPQKHIFLIM